MSTAVKVLRLAVIVAGGWQLLTGQSATIVSWNCQPFKFNNSCTDIITVSTGGVASQMYATCTNKQYMTVTCSAIARDCKPPATLHANTYKQTGNIQSDSGTSRCQPDFQEIWDCTETEASKFGGCEGPC